MAGIETRTFENPVTFWDNCAEGWFELWQGVEKQGDVALEDFWFELVLDAEFMRMVLRDGGSTDPWVRARLLG